MSRRAFQAYYGQAIGVPWGQEPSLWRTIGYIIYDIPKFLAVRVTLRTLIAAKTLAPRELHPPWDPGPPVETDLAPVSSSI